MPWRTRAYLFVVDVDPFEIAHRSREREHRGVGVRDDVVERVRLVEGERTDRQPTQSGARCAQPPSATPRSAASERTYVPLPHSTSTVASGYGPGSKSSTSKRSTRTRRGARSTSTPGTRELVEPASADLHRRHHRRELLELADEARDRGFDVVAGERHRLLLDDLARRVEGAGRDPEHDAPAVGLPGLLEEPQQARGAPETDEQHAGGVGIERARVPDAALPVHLAELGDDVVGRAAGRLVDDDESVSHRLARNRAGQSASRDRAMSSSISSVDSKPAANRWPPPPWLAAIARTSTAPSERRLTRTCRSALP